MTQRGGRGGEKRAVQLFSCGEEWGVGKPVFCWGSSGRWGIMGWSGRRFGVKRRCLDGRRMTEALNGKGLCQ